MAIALVHGTALGSYGPSLTIPSTADHNLLVVFILHSTGTITGIADDATGGSNTYVQIPGAISTGSVYGSTDAWYCQDCKAGATIVTVTASSGTVYAIQVGEFSGASTSAALLTGSGIGSTGPASGNTVGPSMTPTATGQLLTAFVVSQDYPAANVPVASPWSLMTTDPSNLAAFSGYYVDAPLSAQVMHSSPDQVSSNPYAQTGAIFSAAATGPSAAQKASMFLVF